MNGTSNLPHREPNSRFIANEGRNIHIAHWPSHNAEGNPYPAVFCVHGLTRNARDFDFIATHLSESRDVYSIDIVGRGRSDWLQGGIIYDYELYSADVLHVLSELKLSKIDWIGTSMGGILGIVLASSMPDLFRKVVINDIAADVSLDAMQRLHDYVGKAMLHPTKVAAMDYLKKCYGAFGLTEEWQWEHLFSHSFQALENGQYRLLYDPAILNSIRDALGNFTLKESIDLWPFWKGMPQPILLLRGAKSDFLSAETAKSMVDAKPSTTLLEFADCGHAPALMNKEQIYAVSEWLNH